MSFEFGPNDGCSNRESTLAQVQFSSGKIAIQRTPRWQQTRKLLADREPILYSKCNPALRGNVYSVLENK